MRRVIIESPYAGNVEANATYLRRCLRDSLLRGEAPFASHAIYTLPGVLDDARSLRAISKRHAAPSPSNAARHPPGSSGRGAARTEHTRVEQSLGDLSPTYRANEAM